MKLFLICCIWGIINTSITFAQKNIGAIKTESPFSSTLNNPVNLNACVWSQTHLVSDKYVKPVLDFSAINTWQSLPLAEDILISRDGRYIVHGIQNHLSKRLDMVVVQATSSSWKALLSAGARTGFFSCDSKQYIYQNKQDICFLKMGTDECRYENNVDSYKVNSKQECIAYKLQNNILVLLNLISGKETRLSNVLSYNFDKAGECLVYQLNNNDVILRNLVSEKEVVFENVAKYDFDLSALWFVCQIKNAENELKLYNVKGGNTQKFTAVQTWQFFSNGDYVLLSTDKGVDYVNLREGKKTNIWLKRDTNEIVSGLNFDVTGKQVVFDTKIGAGKVIWYWSFGMEKAEEKISSQSMELNHKVTIISPALFTDSGRYLRFTVLPITKESVKSTSITQLDVWSYKDKILQSTQPYLKENTAFSAILNVETGKVLLPEREYERLDYIIGDYALISKSGQDIFGDRFWEKGYYEDSVWLFSFRNGQRRLLPARKENIWFAPDGRYLIYFDAIRKCNYFRYEIVTGRSINISSGIPPWQLGLVWPHIRTSDKPSIGSGVKLWLGNDEGVLVYDRYSDIWKLDASGSKPPINITNGYGRLHNIEFNLLLYSQGIKGKNKIGDGPFIASDTLLLSAVNKKNKFHGFYLKTLRVKSDPVLLSMDPCYMDRLRDGKNGIYPVKADEANTWIVNRQSAVEAPNYYVTHDFKTFKQLTFIQPQKAYNWLSAELHSFKQLDGTLSRGILYKPENFDSTKKYPVIVNFYGTLTGQLNKFFNAEYVNNPSIFNDPAWMASHGYIVFLPDIFFTEGQWGPSVVNTVEGAVRYLKQLPYIDSRHIGAAGHSNSGRFGYYLLTHSKSFAAMSIGAGTTNYISVSLSLHESTETSSLSWGEIDCYGTGLRNLWYNKRTWLDHTAVLSVDKVVTPLLQFHNKKDAVPFEQAVQMFVAMRRLDKKVWLLQYDNGLHTLRGKDAIDWTIRYTQFFDHFLKEAPPARWMTEGIPYNLKGIEGRYDLDTQGKCGENCRVCIERKWLNSNQQVR